MTNQELFYKYELLAPENEESTEFTVHTDCVDYDGFMNALKDHNQQIIKLIDGKLDKLETSRSGGRLTNIALAGVNLTIIRLTELKQEIEKL